MEGAARGLTADGQPRSTVQTSNGEATPKLYDSPVHVRRHGRIRPTAQSVARQAAQPVDPADSSFVEHIYEHDEPDEHDEPNYDPDAPAATNMPFATAQDGARLHSTSALKAMCRNLHASTLGTKLQLAARILDESASLVAGEERKWVPLTKIASTRRPVVGEADAAAGRAQPTNHKDPTRTVADAWDYAEKFPRHKCTVPDIPFAGPHGEPEPNIHGEAECSLSAHDTPMAYFELFLPQRFRRTLTNWTNQSAAAHDMGASTHARFRPATPLTRDLHPFLDPSPRTMMA